MYQSKDGKWKIIIPEKTSEILSEFKSEDILLKRGVGLDYSNPLMKCYIDARWREFVSERTSKGFPEPVNGGLVRVSKLPFLNSDGKIELFLAPSIYKEHIATNFPNDDSTTDFLKKHPEYEFAKRLNFEQNANNLLNVGILTTSDDYLIYTIRNQGTATFGGAISGFGRVINSVEEIKNGGGPNHFFNKLRDSLWNETGMSQSEKSEEFRQGIRVNLGGYAYIKDGFNVPLFTAETSLEKGDLENLVKKNPVKIDNSNQNKFSNFGFVHIDEESYSKFLRNPKLVKTIIPIWTYLAIKRFGLDFLG